MPSIAAIFAGWKRATFSPWNAPVGKSDTARADGAGDDADAHEEAPERLVVLASSR